MSKSCTKLKFMVALLLGGGLLASPRRAKLDEPPLRRALPARGFGPHWRASLTQVRPDPHGAEPAGREVQAARRPLRGAGGGLDEKAVLPHGAPAIAIELGEVVAAHESVVIARAALLDEDEQDAIALVERVRVGADDA